MFIKKLWFLRNNSKLCRNYLINCKLHSECKKPEVLPPVVTVVDTLSTPIGKNVALLLKQNPFIKELRLYDKNKDVCAIAEDVSHIDTNTKVKSYGGPTTLRSAIEGAGIVVSLGGCKQKANETIKELFERNVNDLRNAALHMVEFNPNAVFCIAKPPVEVFVPLVSEEYKKFEVYNKKKIIGITSYTAMRANYFIGKATGQDPTVILCPIVGGNSSKTTVAVMSQTKPKVHIDTKNFQILQDCISSGEEDVLNLYDGCNAVCLASAVGVARFINNVVKAVTGKNNCVDCGFVKQSGNIEKFLTYMTTIIRLSENGVESCHMPKISEHEAARLKQAAVLIRQNISMGENYGHLILNKDICLDNQGQYNVFETDKSIEQSIKNIPNEKDQAKLKKEIEKEKPK